MKLPSIRFGKETLSNFEESINREWVITNGLGGYASSTILGINTRKYHGLLVAALHPPGDRQVCLTKLDEEIIIGNNVYPLGANEFEDGVFPKGYIFLKEFSLSPFPKYVYTAEDVEVQKTIFMPHEKNALITIYRVKNRNDSGVNLRVFPLINWRHFHSVTDRWKTSLEFIQEEEDKQVGIQLGVSQSALTMRSTNACYSPTGKWIEKFYFRKEAGRGESYLDDSYQLGYFEINVKARDKKRFAIIAVADNNVEIGRKILAEIPMNMYDLEALYEAEIRRAENLLIKMVEDHHEVILEDWLKWIVLATDMFIVKSLSIDQKSVIAGYHWFESWGRDTFISLPGLMLVTRRFEDARKVFSLYADYFRSGLIPNYIPDSTSEPTYSTVDATLWFVNAVLQYLKYTADFSFVEDKLWKVLKMIVENHENGTLFNIKVDSDGLLQHGSQLTWMDAAVDGEVITPRDGKAVEIQALWYNALKTLELLASKFGEKHEAVKYDQMAEKTRRSFIEKFWNSAKEYLFDVVKENSIDNSLRPNQIIAVSLDFNMLNNVQSKRIVDVVQKELLTPFGLRTLSRDDPNYVGVYAGDRKKRDRAYHNGTIWPWLLGPFTTAFLKVEGYNENKQKFAFKNFLKPLLTEHALKSRLGVINEIFDGDPPHLPRGCIAQAWSVAELLRSYIEDILYLRPENEKEIFAITGKTLNN